MRTRSSALTCFVLLVLGCAAHDRSTGTGDHVTLSTLQPTVLVTGFKDAESASLDQFLNLYVVDRGANSVLKFGPLGDSLRSVSGTGSGHNQFNGPTAIDARLSNRMLVSDYLNHRVEIYSKELAYASTLYTHGPAYPLQFGYPNDAVSDDAGNIYVADGDNKRVLKARPDLTINQIVGGYADATRPEGIVTNPIALAVDRANRLVVLDNGGSGLLVFDELGNPLRRIELSERGRAVTSSTDTIFVLEKGTNHIRLYQTPLLSEVGRWSLPSLDAPATGLSVRNGEIVVLTMHTAYRCVARPDTVSN